jgi:signal transduction histidine kinase
VWQSNNARAFAGETIKEEVTVSLKGSPLHLYNVLCPIRVDGEIFGILGINVDVTSLKEAQQELDEYREHLEQLVESRTAQLNEISSELSRQLEERRRMEREILEVATSERMALGRDLHDNLLQQLAGTRFQVQALRTGLPEEAPELKDKAGEILGNLEAALNIGYRIVVGLSPVELTDDGLTASLQRLVRDTARIYNLDCRCRFVPEDIQLPEVICIEVYYIAREAVTNAARHSGAASVVLELTVRGGEGTLVVKDNGTGIPPDVGDKDGMGLRHMRYRAGLIDGDLVLESGDPGTIVRCTFPAESSGG